MPPVSVSAGALSETTNHIASYGNALWGLLAFWKRKKKAVHVLRNCSGSFRPGKATLVLGPPGSGKSSLMKVHVHVAEVRGRTLGLGVAGLGPHLI